MKSGSSLNAQGGRFWRTRICETPKELETAKRAVAFTCWARAISNSIPENELQPYMAAHFAWLDESRRRTKKPSREHRRRSSGGINMEGDMKSDPPSSDFGAT